MLSTFFWLLTLLAWLRYARQRPVLDISMPARSAGAFAYVLALVFFALGLLSKPMVVTLPFVLLLLDLLAFESPGLVTPSHRWLGKDLLLEKLPFFILAAAGSSVTYLVQAGWGSGLEHVLDGPAGQRRHRLCPLCHQVVLAGPSAPSIMSIPGTGLSCWQLVRLRCWSCGRFPVLIYRRRSPYLFVGWFWFLRHARSHHRPRSGRLPNPWLTVTHIFPSIGFFIMVVWGWTDFLQSAIRTGRTSR